MKGEIIGQFERQMIHALVIDPRAPFRTLAAALGVSDQTVTRRFRRLQESAGLRVLAQVDSERVGWVDWLVRLTCPPDAAASVAAALAKRPDTGWVRLTSGGTEIVCVVQARSAGQRDTLLLDRLPGSRRVVQISAHSMLHTFSPSAWIALTAALGDDQLAKLRPIAGPSGDDRTVVLDRSDERLIECLAHDGRASNATLAAAIGWHESTVRRRIEELRRSGALYFDIDFDEQVAGLVPSALLWVSVEPARLAGVGQAIATHPEVPFVAATTGPTNLVVSVVTSDTRHLYEYLTGPLAALSGVRAVEVAPIIRTIKKRAGSQGTELLGTA